MDNTDLQILLRIKAEIAEQIAVAQYQVEDLTKKMQAIDSVLRGRDNE